MMEKKPSYFELLTTAAILHFLDKKVDWAVVETGLGGRLDATNVMLGRICAFTDISLEHMETLGDTIEKIASEKAGIIKENSVVVIDKKNKGLRIIEGSAKEKNCKIINPKIKPIKITNNYSTFNSAVPEIKNLKIKLIGFHQLDNAAVALGAIQALREQGVKVSDNAIKRGFFKAEWPGRMQLVKKLPLILLDAAHTPDACKKLMKSLKLFKFDKLVLVFACLNDKDAKGMLREFRYSKLIISKVKNKRAMLPKKIQKFAKGKGRIIEPIAGAIREAEKIASRRDLVLITGSGYAVSEALEYFKIKI
jgi:dihydrofolate synthase/folylpolyglutamate synthase